MEKLLRLSINKFKALSLNSIYLDNFVYFNGEIFIEIIKLKLGYEENKCKTWKIELLKYDIFFKSTEVIKSYDFVTSDNFDYIDVSSISKYPPYEKRKLKKIFNLIREFIYNETERDIRSKSEQNQTNLVLLGESLVQFQNKNLIDILKKSNYINFLLDEKGSNKLGYNLLGNEINKLNIFEKIENKKLILKDTIKNNCLLPNIYDITEAIKDERGSSEKNILFTVENSIQVKDILKVFLNLTASSTGKLDEDLEGCKIWWLNKGLNGKQTKGMGEILSIDIESEIINVRFFKGIKPEKDTKVVIYPKEYLESLEKLWLNPKLSKQALNNYYSDTDVFDDTLKVPNEFEWLRENQKKSFNLFNYSKGILWGPPGTGKTTTLGVLIASYMKENPNKKIMLLSLTNLAIDQLLISVDKQLESFEYGDCFQRKCVRLGSNINSEYYKSKDYLVATKDEQFLEKINLLESKKPDKKDALLYNEWLKEYEELKSKMKINTQSIINQKNLITLTTTRALFEFESLIETKFDLLVFDEASQINLPQAIMLAQLGKQVIYAGDQEQLNPICISKNKNTQKYMGVSIFEHAESIFKNSKIFLNEQSRMSFSICNLVSKTFYNNELIVSLKERENLAWLKERELKKDSMIGANSVFIAKIPTDGSFSQKYRGFIRYDSALLIFNLCKNLLKEYREEDIVILVPFKAQKNLILNFLRKENYFKIKVNTVHKSQGSEYHTVIFDPVIGNSDFLKTREAKNLINVALSRAKARLVMCFSQEDLKNEYLKKIFLINNYSEYNNFDEIESYLNELNFPHNLVGKTFDNILFKGKVLEILDDDKKMKILCFETGKEKKYLVEALNKFI
ncbi:MAG: DEAD/DEAH box helicase [Cetobacterium sp.]